MCATTHAAAATPASTRRTRSCLRSSLGDRFGCWRRLQVQRLDSRVFGTSAAQIQAILNNSETLKLDLSKDQATAGSQAWRHAIIGTRGRALFPVNTTIETVNQLGCPYGEGIAYAKEGRESDGSAGLYLLPVASGKAKSNHVFLGESFGFAKLFYSLSESAKELFLIDQACLLGDLWLDHHEQISCIDA